MFGKKLFLVAIILAFSWGASFFSAPFARADHAIPERLINDTYVVTLLPSFEEEEAKLTFFFREIQSGKDIAVPISFRVFIEMKDGSSIFASETLTAEQGVGIARFPFPGQGIYTITIEFEKADEPGVIYRPADPWSLWVPGEGVVDQYPIGYSEIAGFALLAIAIIAIIINILWRRHHQT